MSPEDAIKLLDNVTAQIPLVRADQNKVLEALAVLRKAIQPKQKPQPEPE